MGPWRAFNWTLVSAPFLLVGWVAFSARVLSFETEVERADPPGFDRAIEAWAPFVREARNVGSDATVESRIERLLMVYATMPDAPRPVPPTQLGRCINTDLRRPLYIAATAVARETNAVLRSLIEQQQFHRVPDLVWGLTCLVQSLRQSDVVALIEANRHLRELQQIVEHALPHFGNDQVAELSRRFIWLEERRKPATVICRTDLTLFNSIVGRSGSDDTVAALGVLRSALREAKRGAGVESFREQAAELKPGPLRDRVQGLLIAWQVVLNQERENRELAMRAIRLVRTEEILRKGLDPAEVPNQGIPAAILTDFAAPR
ncbi:MAG: hypothetical protein AB1725_10510 [Armatimonadota bacterium]